MTDKTKVFDDLEPIKATKEEMALARQQGEEITLHVDLAEGMSVTAYRYNGKIYVDKVEPMKVKVIEDEYPWLTAIVNGRYLVAKVFDEPSEFGFNRGRISKLAIWPIGRNVISALVEFEKVEFHYVRELVKNDLPQEEVNEIVTKIESWRIENPGCKEE